MTYTMMMMINPHFRRPVWAADDGGTASPADTSAAPPADPSATPPSDPPVTPPPAAPPGETASPAATPPADPPADPPKGDDKPWYESREWGDEALKEHLIKTGYHKGTVEEALERALKGEITASAKLGKDPASIMDAPSEGQDINEWMKSNSKHLGVPETADKYDVKLPENLPEGMPIDESMVEAAKANALEMGLPPSVLQANIDFYAKHMTDQFTSMAAKATEAEEKMDTDLKEAWGASWNDNQQLAVRAFQSLAAEMKMDPDVAKNVSSKLNSELGDVGLLKFFHGLATKLGDDTLAIPQGGNAPALALADAQQRKEQIMAKNTGVIAKAKLAGDRAGHKAAMDELKGLNKIIAQYSNS